LADREFQPNTSGSVFPKSFNACVHIGSFDT
jgi:hypothetical protein